MDEEEIIDALTALEYTDTSILGSESIVSVYSYSQVRLLAEYISKGLSEAKADARYYFLRLAVSSRKLLVLTRKIIHNRSGIL